MAVEITRSSLLHEARENIIGYIMDDMSDDERVQMMSKLARVWCRHCGRGQPDRIGGCRCADDS